jgi:hypothetical protein
MSMKDKYSIYKSIRKPIPPATKVERPKKGADYKRPQGTWEKWSFYGNEE